MYGYEYEYNILSVLRFLKYIYLYFPERLSGLLECFKEVDEETLMEDFCFYLWDVFHESYSDWDEEREIEIMEACDPLFERYCELTYKLGPGIGNLSIESVYRKLQDLAEYYVVSVTSTVVNAEVHIASSGIYLSFWLSPDCYEPDSLINALLNFLLALRREIAEMEKMLAEKNTEIIEFPQNTKEEAA